MASDTKIDAATIVSARTMAAQLARKPNGSFDRAIAETIFDWIMAPVMESAAKRQTDAVERMAKARAARKIVTEAPPSDSRPLTMRELANNGR